MSPHAVNNFVSDLVQMAKAMEDLPIAEARIRELEADKAHALDTVQSRELAIIDYKAEIDRLRTTLHEVEVAKDAAETMFLEADDRTAKALDFIKTQFGSAGAIIQALEPPKVVEPQPEPVHVVWPIEQEAINHGNVGQADTHVADTSVGQSEVPPPAISGVSQSQNATTTTARDSDTATGALDKDHMDTPQPLDPNPTTRYVGRRYIDVDGYIHRSDWLAGGGTNEDYDWRGPSVKVSAI